MSCIAKTTKGPVMTVVSLTRGPDGLFLYTVEILKLDTY